MQPPPPTGLTGKAPPPLVSPGDGGVGATLEDGTAALASGLPSSPTPPSAKASTAAPPHNAAILPLRFPMTPDSSDSEPDVHKRNAA
jgi:hypothetical protein